MDWHIDDNGLLTGNNYRFANVLNGNYNSVDIGLKDITTTFPQSTVSKFMINAIRFSFQAELTPPNVGGYIRLNSGILPVGAPAVDYSKLSEFQTVEGWPITKGQKFLFTGVLNPGASGLVSWSHTWRPKNKTALNRMQDIVLYTNSIVGDWTCFYSIFLEGKRVD